MVSLSVGLRAVVAWRSDLELSFAVVRWVCVAGQKGPGKEEAKSEPRRELEIEARNGGGMASKGCMEREGRGEDEGKGDAVWAEDCVD
jgi:hypothetical protein